jgi:polyisoprenoid-binding protein YceI
MKKSLLFTGLLIVTIGALQAQTKLTADIEKSTLTWLGERITNQHTGTIKLSEGWINWQDNKIVSGEFVVNMSTISESGSNAKFEGHMKSDDFFGVEKFPTAKIVIKGSEPFDKGAAVVRGDLTIKGITNPVEFTAVTQKKEDGTRFYANIIFDRSKFDIRYGSGTFFDNLGDRTIFDEIKVKVNLVMN